MNTKKNTLQAKFSQMLCALPVTRKNIVLGTLVALLLSITFPHQVEASTWSPTLLVNTEAFQVIDDGDGSTNIELRFGDSANEILRWDINASSFVFTDDVNVAGNLTISGSLAVEAGNTIALNGVVYTFPQVDGAASGNTLKTDGSATLTWSSDDDVPESGDFGNASGLDSDGSITDGTIVEPDLDADNTASDGDFLQYDSTGTNFVWRSASETLSDLGQNAGTDITADLEEETHASEHESGGNDTIDHDNLVGFVANEHINWVVGGGASANFETTGTVSGATIHGQDLLTSSGGLRIEGAFTGATAFHMNSLVDCNGTSNKLTYNASTGLFSCETDETGAGAQWTDIGDAVHPADGSGAEDVIIGAATEAAAEIKLGSGGNIRARGTLSGYSLRVSGAADVHGALSASGAVRTDGNLTINDDQTGADAVLTFGNDAGNETITFSDSSNNFEVSDDIDVTGTVNTTGNITTDANLTINEDNGGVDAVLTFGNDAATETLTFSDTSNQFEFSDDLHATGALSASGTLSVESNAFLQGNLTVGGTTTFGGVAYTWDSADGASGSVLTTDGAGNLSWSSGTASSGSVVSLHPEYPGAVYFASGATSVGALSGSGGGASYENVYHWTSSQGTQQDYWVQTTVQVPQNFTAWDPVAPIQLRYRTANGTAGTNQVKLVLRDTADALVTLTGNEGLANSSFTTATITGPESAGTYTPGDYITIFVKLATTNAGWAEAGFLNLNWETRD